MGDDPSSASERQRHWDAIYARNEANQRSWYQPEPSLSLELLDMLGVGPDDAVIDVGGGESFLVDRLVERGFSDITVLDISESALAHSRERIGPARGVAWIAQDLLTWQPGRRYDVWHDRAVFHFLAGDQVKAYGELLERTLAPGGAVILATFAPDGPEYCSGLPVTRYSADELADVLGDEFEVVERRNEHHPTPAGTTQSFTWIAARRNPMPSSA